MPLSDILEPIRFEGDRGGYPAIAGIFHVEGHLYGRREPAICQTILVGTYIRD